MKQRLLLTLLLSLAWGGTLEATRPSHWTTSTQREFLEGRLEGVSVTSDGRLMLAPAAQQVFDTGQAYVYAAVADPGGNIYLGTGNEGKIYRVTPKGESKEWSHLEEAAVYALAVDSLGRVYAGTGPDGKVYRLGPGGKPEIFFEPHEKYIWSLLFDRENHLFVGTGPRGILYRVDPQGQGRTFYDSRESHISCLAWDLDGNLLAGSAPGGLLFRFSPEGHPFVLFDSELQEIKAIAVGRYGQIFLAALATPSAHDNQESNPPPGQKGPGTSSSSASGEGVTVRLPADAKEQKLAIFRIDRDNLVERLYTSDQEVAFDLMERGNGNLLVATGNRGRVVSIDRKRFVTFLAQVPEEQVTRLIESKGNLWAATSNLGKLFRLEQSPSKPGVYQSKVFDAGMLSDWGVIRWTASNAKVRLYSRSGNTRNPDQTWHPWSAPFSDSRGSHIESPPARFLQWKIEFPLGETTALSAAAQAVDSVTVSYQQRNMAPEITSVTVYPPSVAFARMPGGAPAGGSLPGGPGQEHLSSLPPSIRSLGKPMVLPPPRRVYSPGARSISWEASDPNGDDLSYSLYYREVGESDWKLLKKGLRETHFTLDGLSFPDGSYVIKVRASDNLSNPAPQTMVSELVSKPFVIANTSPALELSPPQVAAHSLELKFTAHTGSSTVYQVEYSVDSGGWDILFPKDGIADTGNEQFQLQLKNLKPGERTITIRVVDSVGNVATAKTRVRIP